MYGLVTERTTLRDTVEVWPRARTYGQCVTGKPYFHQLSHSSCFLILELLFLATCIDKVAGVALDAPRNVKYISPKIQKEILHILVTKLQDVICKEIGDIKFCLLVVTPQELIKRLISQPYSTPNKTQGSLFLKNKGY
jgi:hypothetical protein